MIFEKVKWSQLFSVVVFLLLLSGCSDNEKSVVNHYYLSLIGESQAWTLTGYEVMITSENFKIGNGTLSMKNTNEYFTDSFQFSTYAVIDGTNTVVHSGSVNGAGIDIAKKSTGAIEGGAYINKKGEPVTLYEVSDIYMIVEWWDTGEHAYLKERINLYSKDRNEKTFLN